MGFLAIPQLVTGLWAVVATENWYENFPGLGPLLVAAEPPLNVHLASDAGSGFIATGVVAMVAALWGRWELVVTAAAGLFAFGLPHAVYHAAHPAESLSATTNTINVVVLTLAVGAPALAAVGALRSRTQVRQSKSLSTREQS